MQHDIRDGITADCTAAAARLNPIIERLQNQNEVKLADQLKRARDMIHNTGQEVSLIKQPEPAAPAPKAKAKAKAKTKAAPSPEDQTESSGLDFLKK